MTTLTEPLSIVDYATGVSGSYCIGKRNPTGFWSYWNPSGWAGSGYLFEDRKLAERVLQLLDVIEAAKFARIHLMGYSAFDKFDVAIEALDKEQK